MDGMARVDVRTWRGIAAALILIVPLGCQTGQPWQQEVSGESVRVAATQRGARDEDAPRCVAATRTPLLSPPVEPDNPYGLVPVSFVAPPVAVTDKEGNEGAVSSQPVLPPPVADYSIDLPTALGLAGVENPTIALAQEAIRAGLAEQLQADALLIPSLQAGTSFNAHRGNLLSAQGLIQNVDRQSLYAGAGAAALGGGTVGFPGVYLTAQLADAVFEPIVARNRVMGRQFDAQAISNAILLEVTTRYFDLLGAEARLATVQQSERDLGEVVRLTDNFAKSGQGRRGDANRARTEALLLRSTAQRVEEDGAVAAAELARLLHMDTAVRLRGCGDRLVPITLVDPAICLDSLIQTAVDNRPEVAARTADIALAEARLRQERVRPFVPFLSVGASYGAFGGGGNLADTQFGHFSGRTDFDALAVWTLQNFGLGNYAIQRGRQSLVGQALAQRALAIDQVRHEVAEARALGEANRLEIEAAQRRVVSATRAYQEDSKRARNLEGLPIELLSSVNQLTAARQDLIRTLVEFNQAQFRLFVALGKPPTLVDERPSNGCSPK
jgi:outer membrane protein TolC